MPASAPGARRVAVCLFLACLLAPSLSQAQTDVQGRIEADVVWDGVIRVVDDVVVLGATVTVTPGTEVRFAGAFDIDNRGSFNAIGTAAEPIVFTSDAGVPSPGDWGYLIGGLYEHVIVEYGTGLRGPSITESTIRFMRGQGGHGILGGDAVIRGLGKVQNCVIEDNTGMAIISDGGSAAIAFNTIRRNTGGGIRTRCGCEMHDNIIEDNGGDGINAREGSGRIWNNVIRNNGGWGHITARNGANVYGNTFEGNGRGGIDVTPWESSAREIHENLFLNHDAARPAISAPTYRRGTPVVNATENWWGTTHVPDIKAQVLDIEDDVTAYRKVELNPIWVTATGPAGSFPEVTLDVTPRFGQVPLTVDFTSTAADPDGSIVKSTWDFDDTVVVEDPADAISHTYTAAGEYFARRKVEDDAGLSNEVLVKVVVVNPGEPIPISGVIEDDLTLSAPGTYRVVGNIDILGATLTIEPGVRVEFDGRFYIAGSISAIGTQAEPILFTSANANPSPGDWHELRGGTYQHVVVEYGNALVGPHITDSTVRHMRGENGHGILGGQAVIRGFGTVQRCIVEDNIGMAIISDGGSNAIAENTFRRNSGGGVRFRCGCEIRDNLFEDNGGDAINSREGSGAVYGNTIRNNSGWGHITARNGANVYENIFDNNGRGGVTVTPWENSAREIHRNLFLNSGPGKPALEAPSYRSGTPVVNATENWWGTTHVPDIKDMILDRDDNVNNYRVVDINPIWVSPTGPAGFFPTVSLTRDVPYGETPLDVGFAGTWADSDGTLSSVVYDFGDGATDASGANNVSHTFTTAGDYEVELTVIDDAGLSNSASVPVVVVDPGQPVTISGVVDQDLHLRAPFEFLVTGNIDIIDGAQLRIDPGVRVAFDGYYYIAGNIFAHGTAAEPIVFTSAKATPAPADWNELRGGSYEHVIVEYGTSLVQPSITDCLIHFMRGQSGHGILGGEGVVRGLGKVQDCTIEDNHGWAIISDGGSAAIAGNIMRRNTRGGTRTRCSCEIRDNIVEDNGGDGIQSREGSGPVHHNLIRNNANWGHVTARNGANVHHNIIEGNGRGGIDVTPWERSGREIHDNHLLGHNASKPGIRASNHHNGTRDINAEGNWWGSVNPAEIEVMIEDFEDNVDFFFVHFDPPAAGPIADVGPRLSFPPQADAGGPYTGQEGIELMLDGSLSTDLDDDIVTYAWDVDGDGQVDVATDANKVLYAWADDYAGPVLLTVTDSEGATGTAVSSASIVNVPPAVDIGSDRSVALGEAVDFAAIIVDAPGDTHDVDWQLGDGQSLSGVAIEHTYAAEGTYTVTVDVRDDDGGRTVLDIEVQVIDAAIKGTPPALADDEMLYSFDFDSSVEGQADCEYSLVNAPAGMTVDGTSGVLMWTPVRAQAGQSYEVTTTLLCPSIGLRVSLTWTVEVIAKLIVIDPATDCPQDGVIAGIAGEGGAVVAIGCGVQNVGRCGRGLSVHSTGSNPGSSLSIIGVPCDDGSKPVITGDVVIADSHVNVSGLNISNMPWGLQVGTGAIPVRDVRIEGNTIHGCTRDWQAGIALSTVYGAEIHNNVIYGCRYGISVQNGSRDLDIAHNSIVHIDGSRTMKAPLFFDAWSRTASTGLTLNGNLLGNRSGTLIYNPWGMAGDLVADGNVYLRRSNSAFAFGAPNLGTWQAQTGQDAGSIELTPADLATLVESVDPADPAFLQPLEDSPLVVDDGPDVGALER